MFEDCVLFATEPGYSARDWKRRPVDITKWTTFKRAVDELEERPDFAKQVVVDTADLLYVGCRNFICRKLGITHPSDEEYGKGWDLIKQEFGFHCARLAALRPTIWISHVKVADIKRKGGETTHKIVPTMSNGARAVLEPMVDLWSYMDYDAETDNPVLHVRGDDLISAGHRFENHFVGVKRIPMGDSPAEGYKNFVEAFNRTERPTKRKATLKRGK